MYSHIKNIMVSHHKTVILLQAFTALTLQDGERTQRTWFLFTIHAIFHIPCSPLSSDGTSTLRHSYFCLSFPCLLRSYTKNLSADKVNLSAFRGEGELSNLQLDENVLTDLLELPAWLRLTSAWCNHVSFRISWTKLKSTPITLVSRHYELLG